jgi:hypothetical protein
MGYRSAPLSTRSIIPKAANVRNNFHKNIKKFYFCLHVRHTAPQFLGAVSFLPAFSRLRRRT